MFRFFFKNSNFFSKYFCLHGAWQFYQLDISSNNFESTLFTWPNPTFIERANQTSSYLFSLSNLAIFPWWNGKLMKWQVDEMASWWNGKLMKWHVDQMISWWNCKLTICCSQKNAYWWFGKLVKWLFDKMASWWNAK